jgi:hypothetical protein
MMCQGEQADFEIKNTQQRDIFRNPRIQEQDRAHLDSARFEFLAPESIEQESRDEEPDLIRQGDTDSL